MVCEEYSSQSALLVTIPVPLIPSRTLKGKLGFKRETKTSVPGPAKVKRRFGLACRIPTKARIARSVPESLDAREALNAGEALEARDAREPLEPADPADATHVTEVAAGDRGHEHDHPVAACAGDVHRHSAFDLADALGQRDRQKALGLLRRVLADEREALRVLHALVGHFRRLWQVKELLDSGAPEGQIERAVGLRGFRLQALLGQSRLYTTADLRRFLHSAAALDLRLKSTRTAPSVLFDALVLEVCARPA